MDSTNALLDIHRVPRNIEIEQHAGELNIDALTASCRADKDTRAVAGVISRLFAFV
jgi:hypothetical protein